MEKISVFHDVPAIEMGAGESNLESSSSYGSLSDMDPQWRQYEPYLTPIHPSSIYSADISAQQVNMEKRMQNLSNPACGNGHLSGVDVFRLEPYRSHDSQVWRSERPRSPLQHRWSCSSSSTKSGTSDYTLSPDINRHHSTPFSDDIDPQTTADLHHSLSLAHDPFSYASHGSWPAHMPGSPAPVNMALACTMKQVQYDPDPELESLPGQYEGIKTEPAGSERLALTPVSLLHDPSSPGPSDYDESIKDEDEDEEIVDSGIDSEYSPKVNSRGRRCSGNKPVVRSLPVSKKSILKTKLGNDRIVKSSQRVPSHSHKKSKAAARRQSSASDRSETISRPFICAFYHYGCSARFSSKNEWKRHVSSQHLQLGVYRCNTGNCNPNYRKPPSGRSNGANGIFEPPVYNDFNRKDLFTQHHRRMHVPWAASGSKAPSKKAHEDFESSLESVRQQCWIQRRQPPQHCGCIFCDWKAEGSTAWEERMEHVGKHFEKADRARDDIGFGDEDLELRRWALQEGIVVDKGNKGLLLDNFSISSSIPVPRARRRSSTVAKKAGPRSGKVVSAVEIADEDAAGDIE